MNKIIRAGAWETCLMMNLDSNQPANLYNVIKKKKIAMMWYFKLKTSLLATSNMTDCLTKQPHVFRQAFLRKINSLGQTSAVYEMGDNFFDSCSSALSDTHERKSFLLVLTSIDIRAKNFNRVNFNRVVFPENESLHLNAAPILFVFCNIA